jgi:hypothetical protein
MIKELYRRKVVLHIDHRTLPNLVLAKKGIVRMASKIIAKVNGTPQLTAFMPGMIQACCGLAGL